MKISDAIIGAVAIAMQMYCIDCIPGSEIHVLRPSESDMQYALGGNGSVPLGDHPTAVPFGHL